MTNDDDRSEGPGATNTSTPAPRGSGHLSLAPGVDATRAQRREPMLPPLRGSMAHSHSRGEVFRVEGTNVVRVPFGVRQSRRARPERPDRWVTLVLPFQSSPTPTPPQAA